MSVTFHQVPEQHMSGFDPQIFLASADNAWQENFRYRVRILDSNNLAISEFRYPPHYEYGTCLFDPQRIVENYLSYDITNLINGSVGFKKGVNTWYKYKINVAEEWFTDLTNTLVIGASATSDYVYVINSAQSYYDSINKPISQKLYYTLIGTAKFFTNQPDTIDIRVNDSYELRFGAFDVTANVPRIRIKTYDVNNNLLKSSYFTNPFLSDTDDASKFLSFLCGPGNINSWTVSGGSAQPLIQDNVQYYEVMIEHPTFGTRSKIKTFNIDRECTRSGSYDRIFWLNPLGGFDAFNFTRVREDNIEVFKSTYGKLRGVLGETSYTQPIYQQGRSTYFTKSKQKYILKSGWINNDTAIWLKEMMQSPLHYMIVDGKFYSINVLTSSYNTKTTLKEKLFNIEIEIELAIDTQRQRL